MVFWLFQARSIRSKGIIANKKINVNKKIKKTSLLPYNTIVLYKSKKYNIG